MTKERKKMANRVPTALANAMAAVASLRDFVRRSFFSFVDLHFISVYKLPFSRCFPPCNERFAFALWSGKLPRPSMR